MKKDNKELSLKEIQDESFKILLTFKKICEENNFKYWLGYGTLLGAIRHDGFIPWDDDIDVQMPREDYERFVEYCITNKQQLLPLELHHYKTNKKYIYPIARFSNSSFYIDYKDTKEYGLGTFIDIYPMDFADANNEKFLKIRSKYLRKIGFAGLSHYSAQKGFSGFLKRLYFCYSRFVNVNKVIKKYDNFFKENRFGNANYSCFVWGMCHLGYSYKDFEKTTKHVFNGHDFVIPCEYDRVLRLHYGDYMKLPPIEEQVGHHFYSVYKKQ